MFELPAHQHKDLPTVFGGRALNQIDYEDALIAKIDFERGVYDVEEFLDKIDRVYDLICNCSDKIFIGFMRKIVLGNSGKIPGNWGKWRK